MQNKYLVIILMIYSCRSSSDIKNEYFDDGSLASTKTYDPSKKNGAAKDFYRNGKIKAEYSYKNDKLNGEYISYDSNGVLKIKAYYFDGNVVGPNYNYYNGRLWRYNEKDGEKVYYVKLYDTLNFKLTKEEGICISPKIVQSPYYSNDTLCTLSFFYAEPDGYKNYLRVLQNNKEINIVKTSMHKVDFSFPAKMGDSSLIRIYSNLKSDKDSLICQDSLVTTITILRR